MRIRAGVSSIAIVAIASMSMMVFSPLASTAGAHQATEKSTCRGSVLRLTALNIPLLEPTVVQNAPGQNCTQQSKTLLGPIDLGIIQLAVGNASTKIQGTARHPNTTAEVANLNVIVPGIITVGASVIKAQTNAGKCSNGIAPGSRPNLTSNGIVANVFINGDPIEIGSGPVTIPVLGLATLSFNQVQKSLFSVTRRAVRLQVPLLGIDLVVAEAQAGYDGHPCDAV
jgi:hypothetical protein